MTILPRPSIIIPPHRLTWCALNAANDLAARLVPLNDAQRAAQQRIQEAAQSGNLYDTREAVQAASTTGRRGIATLAWRRWALDWEAEVRRLILGAADEERAA